MFDLTCRASAAADDIFARVVGTVAAGSADLIVATSTWWAGTDSVDPRAAAVLTAQHATAPLALALLVGGVLVAAIRMILSRKAEPLLAVAAGLTRFVLVSALGLTVLAGALQAGDALSRQLLGDAADQFASFMRAELTAPGESLFVTLLVAVVGGGAVAGAVAADGAAAGRAAGAGGDAAARRVRARGPGCTGWRGGWRRWSPTSRPRRSSTTSGSPTCPPRAGPGHGGGEGDRADGAAAGGGGDAGAAAVLRLDRHRGRRSRGRVGVRRRRRGRRAGLRRRPLPALTQAAAVDATGPGSTGPAGAAAGTARQPAPAPALRGCRSLCGAAGRRRSGRVPRWPPGRRRPGRPVAR